MAKEKKKKSTEVEVVKDEKYFEDLESSEKK